MTSNPIEDYLSGQLSPEEAEAFEAKLDKDPELRLLVQEQLWANAVVWQGGREREKAYLMGIDEQLEGDRRSRRLRYVLIGIAAIFLLLAGLVYLFLSPGNSPQEMFATYYDRPAAPEVLSPGADSLLLMAHSAFNQNRMAEARALYETALRESKEAGASASEAALYLGICYLEEHQPEKALKALDRADAYPEQVQWYRTLACLEAGDLKSAHMLAKEIAETGGHFFQEKAVQLLKAL